MSPVKVYADSVIIKWKENFDGGLPNITFKLQYRPQGAIFSQMRMRHETKAMLDETIHIHTLR